METAVPTLFANRFVEDTGRAHIEIANQEVCRDTCAGKYCTSFCPARVFSWDEPEGRTEVAYASCLECGACAIGCPYDNILSVAPRGGFGVEYDFV